MVHTVEHHDLVVVASDGLFDNLYDSDVLRCMKLDDIEGSAECLAEKSRLLGLDKEYESPFA